MQNDDEIREEFAKMIKTGEISEGYSLAEDGISPSVLLSNIQVAYIEDWLISKINQSVTEAQAERTAEIIKMFANYEVPAGIYDAITYKGILKSSIEERYLKG